MQHAEESFYLEDRKVFVYRRGDCGGVFHARIRLKGQKGYIRRSLSTGKREEATTEAEKLYRDLRYNLERGISISGKKFNRVCDEYLADLAEQVKLGKAKEKKLKDYTLIASRYLKDFFTSKSINQILEKDIDSYRDWREKYWITGKGKDIEYIEYERSGKVIRTKARHLTPSSSTLNCEETVLRKVFEFAVKKGYLARTEIPMIRTSRVKSNRRPGFSIDGWRTLWRLSLKRTKEPVSERVKRQRLLLHDFILIMANSGLRPIEAKTLQWKDIGRHISPNTKNEHVLLSVRGKSKRRDMIAQPKIKGYLDRLRERQEGYSKEHGFKIAPDDMVFSDEFNNPIDSFKKGFEALLESANLTYDNHGQKRSIYSLRHTYGTFRVLYGKSTDVFLLAENMGTSVEMIKKHYYHGNSAQVADKITE